MVSPEPMRTPTLLVSVAMLAIALSGCADSDDGGAEPVSSSAPQDALDESPAPGVEAPAAPSQPAIEEEPEPIELSGSVSGVLDCQLVGQGQAALMGGSESIPAEAYERSYSISIVADETLPVPNPAASVCVFIDGAAASMSGSIPADASSFELYADGAPNGIGYSILIE